MKKVIRLTESQLNTLIVNILKEQYELPKLKSQFVFPNLQHVNNICSKNNVNGCAKDGIYTNFDKAYDYKLSNGVWYTKSKGSTNWIDLTNHPDQNIRRKSLEILNQKIDKIKKGGQVIKKNDKIIKKPVPNPIEKTDTIVSKTTNPTFLKKIAFSDKQINPTKSTPIFSAGQPECAKFVHDFDSQLSAVGNAWMAHNNDQLGPRIFTVFHGIPSDKVNKIIQLWEKIDKSGGPQGNFIDSSKSLVASLITKSPPKLQLNDIVGLYYPPSKNHEIAFYSAGKNDITGNRPYIEKKNGKYIPGNSIKSGDGWGMNTHVGIVGAIKNGVPIIFHNVHGQVYADPYNNLLDNSKIVWVRRPGSEPIALNKIKSRLPISEQTKNRGLTKNTLIEQKPDNLMPGQSDNYYNTYKNTERENIQYKKYSCVPEPGFRPVIDQLISEGYDKKLLKVALGVIGRESSYGSGFRYNITKDLKIVASYFGVNTSVGPAQMKQSTAKDLNLKDSILTLRGSLIGVYKVLQTNYKKAISEGYSTNEPTINFKEGSGDAALDIAIASYNIGVGRITKYCATNDPNIKRPCSKAGQIVENTNDSSKKYKVSNNIVKNYLPNFKTQRWDKVNISTHGYVKEVVEKMKSFNCF